MYPVIVYHEQAGQPRSCLCGLERYARRVARSNMTGRFATAADARDWLWAQPVLLDDGRGETERGCSPEQRSRVWPKDGLNCWEATGHWLGWHMANQSPVEAHLIDTYINGQRHVFPAARYLDDSSPPRAIVLQPPPGWQHKAGVRGAAARAAQALGALPAPLRLVRTRSYFIYDDIESFITEVGGDKSRKYRALLPESILQQLPAIWRQRPFTFYPTANGDVLFGILEPSFVLGQGTAYVISVPQVAQEGARVAGGSGEGGAARRGGLPPGAPPANSFGWARGLLPAADSQPRSEARKPANAAAWYNDLLGGTHYVGDKVLRAFGLGGVSDTLADVEGDALPDYARTDDQRRMRELERAAEQAAQPDPETGAPPPDDAVLEDEPLALQMQRAVELHRQQQEEQRQLAAEIDAASYEEMNRLSRESQGTGPLGSKTNPIIRERGGNL